MLKYCCEWEQDKVNTWSGTQYHLLKALKKEINAFKYSGFENYTDKEFSFKKKISR